MCAVPVTAKGPPRVKALSRGVRDRSSIQDLITLLMTGLVYLVFGCAETFAPQLPLSLSSDHVGLEFYRGCEVGDPVITRQVNIIHSISDEWCSPNCTRAYATSIGEISGWYELLLVCLLGLLLSRARSRVGYRSVRNNRRSHRDIEIRCVAIHRIVHVVRFSRWSLAKGIVALTCLLMIGASEAHAATYYWVGRPGGNTNDSANWSRTNPTSCRGGGAGVPTTGDIVNFDADCDNDATMNANFAA